jgi:hypothetical protein
VFAHVTLRIVSGLPEDSDRTSSNSHPGIVICCAVGPVAVSLVAAAAAAAEIPMHPITKAAIDAVISDRRRALRIHMKIDFLPLGERVIA